MYLLLDFCLVVGDNCGFCLDLALESTKRKLSSLSDNCLGAGLDTPTGLVVRLGGGGLCGSKDTTASVIAT